MASPRGKSEASTGKKSSATRKSGAPSGRKQQQLASSKDVDQASSEPKQRASNANVNVKGNVNEVNVAGRDIIYKIKKVYKIIFQGERWTDGPGWLVNFVERIQRNIVVAVIAFIVITLGPTAYFYYQFIPKPPKLMTGEWNVAVARFTPTGGDSIDRDDADLIASVFFNYLQTEMADLSDQADLSIQVRSPEETGTIAGETPEARALSAETLAEQINAHVVVYGTVARNGDSLELRPEFFVGIKNFYEAEELVGGHSFGGNIKIIGSGGDLPSQIGLNRELSHRSQAMALITRGLSLYVIHAYDDALAVFEEANQDDFWKSNDGREVLYLFQGNAAGRALLLDDAEAAYTKALKINPDYARGYAGLGSVYYLKALQDVTSVSFEPDEDLLDQAIDYLDQALKARLQPPTADIPTKAAIGLGQVYLAQWLAGQNTMQQATDQFNKVIEDYGDGKNPRVKEFAAEAHARLGLIERQQGNTDRAIEEFSTAITLSSTPSRRGLYWATLADLYSKLNQTDQAKDASQKSIDEYQAAMVLTSQAALRAEYWTDIARRYKALQNLDRAIEAGNKATELAAEAVDLAKGSKDLRGLQSAVSAHVELAGIELAIGDIDTAIKDYQKAIEFSTCPAQQAEYWVTLADVYDGQGNKTSADDALNNAVDAYTQAIGSASRDVVKAAFWEQIGVLYQRLGETDQARGALQKAIDLSPTGSVDREKYQAQLDALR